jgi:hypothetical protein
MRYCTNITAYLNKAQDKALKHKVTTQPLYQSDENEIMWSYEVECKGKLCLGPKREKVFQIVELDNQICRCTCQKPLLLHIPCTHVIVVCYELQQFSSKGMCHGTTTRKLFETFGTKQFRVTSCRVRLLKTLKKMLCTYQIQILSYVKALEDRRRRGLGTTWMKQKLELQ